MARLYVASYSPFSERALWALDHHRVPYQRVEHLPMLGEPMLRMRTGIMRGKLSVPVFVDGKTVVRDSVEIARHAERVGSGTPLFTDGVEPWIEKTNAVLEAGRSLLMPRILASPDAQREALPRWVPKFLRGAMSGTARTATRYLMRKYATAERAAGAETVIRRFYDEVRAAQRDKRRLVADRFTFADLAVATALQMVRPVDHPAVRLGPATREVWTHHDVAKDYEDLLAWRDEIYAAERGVS